MGDGVVRAMPIGAELQPGGGVHFRVWAPLPETITLEVDGQAHPLKQETGGYRSAFIAAARAGSRYGFRVGAGDRALPDPASRCQPDGPHGLSDVVDPSTFRWNDGAWPGIRGEDEGHVVYEMHVGTFTREGTWAAAIDKLPLLKETGISVIEMMPVAEFPGRFGWGYDGVALFAPTRLYGGPDDLRRFIDAAHAIGLGVILDVVYNHFGPDGNYLPYFASTYITDKYENEWGDAVNFDADGAAPVREFVCENAAYWVREFHFDGLRLDATQQIFDASPRNIVAELTAAARAAAGDRSIFVVAENEPQDSRLVRPEPRGYGLDGVWNEDLHHSAHVTLTGRNEAYFSDYTGSACELLACVKHGFLYQGQRSAWQKKPRGAPALDIAATGRVNFLENHDQVANSGFGKRLVDLSDRARLRAMTALLLLAPGTPMLFQGQEFASSTPFLYFADHRGELAQAVASGRREFLAQFPSLTGVELDAPTADATFSKCVIDWAERSANAWAVALHRDLTTLRRTDPILSRAGKLRIDGAVLSAEAFLVRLFGGDADRLLVFNFGLDWAPRIVPEPLLAPPAGATWRLIWSSEHPSYGGDGAREPVHRDGSWHVQGRSACVLASA